jgi:ferritin-like metal-binding protein YciE
MVMKLPSLHELLVDQLKDLYSAESQLVKALPKMAKGASSVPLKEAIENHLEETEGQVARLQQIAEILDCKLTGHKCAAMEGLVEEGSDILDADGAEAVIDAGIIAAAQRVEHYEIAAYGTARKMSELLGEQEVADLLQQTLEEEKAADQKLTEVVEEDIYPQALQAESMEENEGNGRRKANGKASGGTKAKTARR